MDAEFSSKEGSSDSSRTDGALAHSFRKLRREGQIHPHAGIAYFPAVREGGINRIYISTNSGRVLRALIICENGQAASVSGDDEAG